MKKTVRNSAGFRWFFAIAAVIWFLLAGNVSSRADSYTYTVTVSAGNQGSFSGIEDIRVDNSETGSDYSITLSGNKIWITGLKLGDIVSCNAQSAVSVSEDSKYYVRGIRQSGRDNNTVADSAFPVTGDADYVVAYGIPGDLTQYTVYYLDEDGIDLAEPKTYYGNVGDKPVIAYLYIDGYVPATYNETKELVKDSSQNIFAFVYMRSTGNSENENGGESVTESGEEGTEILVIETEIIEETEYVELDPNGPNGSAEDPDGDGSGGNGEDGQDDQTFSVIDDVLVPLANLVGDTIQKMAENGTLIPTAVGLLAVIALIILLILFLFRRKKKDEEEEEEASAGEADASSERTDSSAKKTGKKKDRKKGHKNNRQG